MSLKGKKVLILDDDPDFRMFVRKMLEHQGMQVMQCATIAEALEVLEVNYPHLLILDLNLANESGFDLLKFKNSKAAMAQMPTLVCSAYGHRKNLETLVTLGVFNILVKPINNYKLIKKVREVLLNWKSPFYYKFDENAPGGLPAVKISLDAELNGINECYGVITSSAKLDETEKFAVSIELFTKNKINITHQEITNSSQYLESGVYKSNVIFLGMSENSASIIRKLQSSWGVL